MADTATLSLGQERLWFLDQLTPGDASYNIPIALSVRGPFDPVVFAAALSDVVARHEPLRTVVHAVDGRPVGVVRPPAPVAVEQVDLSALPEPDAIVKANALTTEWSNRPFDLATGPLLRAATVRIAERHHVVSVVVHHIGSDGWSMGVLFSELTTCYDARAAGTVPVLAALPVTYPEVARRQRAETGSAAVAARLAYWSEKLSGAPVLDLPTDRPRPAVKTSRGGFRAVELSSDLVSEVAALGRACRVTPFMVYLTAFQVLLWRYAGQRDFCVGTSISGRHEVDLEPLVGLFSNTIVLRADLSGVPTFRDLVRRTRTTTLEAFGNQDIPFEQLLTELQVERDLSRSPIFDVMFTIQNFTTGGGFAPDGLEVTQFEAGIEQAKYDLAVELWTAGDGLSAQFNYNTDLYDGATAERMAGHYRHLLRAAVADPDTPMAALPLLTPEERERLLVGWNDTGTPLPDDAPVSAAVEEQARRRPDAVAVVAGDRTYSYGELVTAGYQVAARLRTAGVGPGDLVGLCAPRSFAAVAGMLGVWLAGAAYVPLDPDHPEERLRLVARDCGARVVLTTTGLRDRLGWFAGSVVDLDDRSGPVPATGSVPVAGSAPAARLAPANGPVRGTGGDVAYQIYTSGSTGVPKGVAVEHRSVRNLLDSMRGILDAGPDDVWLGLTSLSFDISTLELMLPLGTGGRVVLVPDQDVNDGWALAALVRGHGVTHVQATPSSWQLLVEAEFTAPGVVALSGGEALPAPLAREIRGRVKRLYNVYGPTETTIWSTLAELSGEAGAVSIGRPLGNTRCYVLDEAGDPSPVGVPGELLIGGAGLARGYPGRPGLTAQRFVPDPYGPRGGRLYRTGDRVRWQPDGMLTFLGRTDGQVKLRGHRIELGEIESVLLAMPDVARAAVVVREDVPGDRKLVGYLTPAAVASPDAAQLRRDLAARLPAHMVPSALVVLETLPRTPNGKLDRVALPAPSRERPVPRGDTGDPVAEAVSRIWCEVLGLEQVGLDEDLFDLGGHSLTITQIAARIRDRLGADVPLHVFYDESTVSAIAAAVRRIRP